MVFGNGHRRRVTSVMTLEGAEEASSDFTKHWEKEISGMGIRAQVASFVVVFTIQCT